MAQHGAFGLQLALLPDFPDAHIRITYSIGSSVSNPVNDVCPLESEQIAIGLRRDRHLSDVPVILFWDRAPWHRGKAIDQVLEANPPFEIIFFPTASPDLNPQQHVWKAVRTEVSHNHLEAQLPQLADRFLNKLNSNSFKAPSLRNMATLPFTRCLFDRSLRDHL